MKKRILALFMAAITAASLAGCGAGGSGSGAAGMIDKVDMLEIAGFDEAYLPDTKNIVQQEGQVDVVILFEGTEKGWEALAKEYERIQGGYVTVKLDTTYTNTSIYTDKLRSEVQGTTNWDIVQGNLLGELMDTYCINMSSWITKDNPYAGAGNTWKSTLIVKNRFIDWNGFKAKVTKPINSEMPAVYFAQALNTFVTYDGAAPWTDSELDRQSNLGSWTEGAYVTENPSEGWFAWVNEDDYGIGMYVPGIPFYASGRSTETTSASEPLNSNAYESSMLTEYRPKNTSDYSQCYVINTDYTAPVITTTMDNYVPLEYSYVISINTVDNLRNSFKAMDQNGTIDNSGLSAWDD